MCQKSQPTLASLRGVQQLQGTRRGANAAILPEYETVIFDEAHTVESVAADHLGLAFCEGQIEYLLNRLYDDQQQRRLLLTHGLKSAQAELKSASDRCTFLAGNLKSWFKQSVPASVYWIERSGAAVI